MITRFKTYLPTLRRSKSKEAGVALAIVAMVLILLTLLVTSGLYIMITETRSSSNFRYSNQAYYVAEAGVQRSIDWFSHQYAPASLSGLQDSLYPAKISNQFVTFDTGGGSTYPDSTQVTSFTNFLSNANNITLPQAGNLTCQYSVTARLLSSRAVIGFLSGAGRVERWRIESTGTMKNGTVTLSTSQVAAVIETISQPIITKAICGSSIVFNSAAQTNSYDSSTGTSTTSNTDGTIGTYGPCSGCKMNGGSGSMVYGELDIGSSSNLSAGSCTVNSTLGCGTNYCNLLPTIPAFCNSTSTTNSPPPNASTTEHGCPTCTPKTYLWYAGSCLTNGCPFSATSAPTATADGRKFSTPSNANLTIGLPPPCPLCSPPFYGTSGDVCFWFNQITINSTGPTSGPLTGVPVKFDNLTNRIGPGKMNIYTDQFDMSSGSLTINSDTSDPIYLYINSKFSQNGGTLANTPLNDAGFFIIYAGSSAASVTGGSGSGFVFISTDSAAAVNVNGGSQIYGAIYAAGPVTLSGGTPATSVHFDKALEKNVVNLFNFVPNLEVRRIQ